MKVTTDACLFGAWASSEVESEKLKIASALDIGTGTGLLSLMFAQKCNGITIDAIEIDEAAAEQATENIASSKWKQSINIINTDARRYSSEKKYDLIFSNPPFYENELRSEDERKNIAHHGQNLSLEELVTVIKKNLDPDGDFFVLLPYKRNEEIKSLFRDHPLNISGILFVSQSVKHDFFRIFIKGNLKPNAENETKLEEISIWDDQQQYTAAFVHLLKDYYLLL
jgi:tRNA1Val (adenine37-N6)-methyltransferase